MSKFEFLKQLNYIFTEIKYINNLIKDPEVRHKDLMRDSLWYLKFLIEEVEAKRK